MVPGDRQELPLRESPACSRPTVPANLGRKGRRFAVPVNLDANGLPSPPISEKIVARRLLRNPRITL